MDAVGQHVVPELRLHGSRVARTEVQRCELAPEIIELAMVREERLLKICFARLVNRMDKHVR